ncbi:hypothetical protein CSIV_04285 [Microbacterium sp. CSI-V]|uniref:hypothetical protein n=1 Tax=unclassified Microbacterium TaxID=2609290 RepID=UPI00097C1309|nr:MULTISPECIES: hypothetical protein [unclassified Microbacterium]MXS74721.1 hypothetical protein [Microbacterium sp. TL13]ONI65511.1 hypothetical protein CSIV_04285 [Microbacterium sp. CSI-V]
MAHYEIDSVFPDITTVEADSFYVKDDFVHFAKRVGHSDETFLAIRSDLVQMIRQVPSGD